MVDQRSADSDGVRRGRLDQVSGVYDRWSGIYDWNPAMRMVRPIRKRAVASMGLSPGETVIDMGTGTGANLPHLREAVGPTGAVVGIDASAGMIAKARERIDRHGWENVHLVRGDIGDPPIDGPVDGIISSFVVTMFERPDRLLEEWATYLDGGALATIYASPSSRWYGPPVNALLDLYCYAFNAGWDADFTAERPGALLARRGRRARTALTDLAASRDHEDTLFGLVSRETGSVVGDG